METPSSLYGAAGALGGMGVPDRVALNTAIRARQTKKETLISGGRKITICWNGDYFTVTSSTRTGNHGK